MRSIIIVEHFALETVFRLERTTRRENERAGILNLNVRRTFSIRFLNGRQQTTTEIVFTHVFQVFDREGDDGKFVSVTVKATDHGEPALEGVCSFTVEIQDVNDNPPLFDRQVC